MTEAPPQTQMTRRQLYRLVWSKPLSVAAEELGMSTNGLAKICNRVNVPYPARGYWARRRAGRPPATPPLPPKAPNDEGRIAFYAERSPSRRARTRKDPASRREELIQAARVMIARDGPHSTTMKRLAAEIGVSEAMAHNYFTRDTLFVEIARVELEAMERARQLDMATSTNALERGAAGTRRYLREVDRRGALIQVLVTLPAVREALRQERKSKSRVGVDRMIGMYGREYGVPPEIMGPASRIITAAALRAGRQLADKLIDLETAERLLLPMIAQCNKRIVERWGVRR